MTRRARRNHTPAFKAKLALAAIKGEKTQQFDVRTRSRSGRLSCSRAAGVFGSGPSEAAPVDLKALHAKIGELTLENDFLAGALNKPAC
jgi:transposase